MEASTGTPRLFLHREVRFDIVSNQTIALFGVGKSEAEGVPAPDFTEM
jgi:hypothetical protein